MKPEQFLAILNGSLRPLIAKGIFRGIILFFASILFFGGTKIYSQDVVLLNSVSNGKTIESCFANFFDSGGSGGNYGNNEDYSLTFISFSNKGLIKAIFSSLNIQAGDTLFVYDSNGNQIQAYTNTGAPPAQILSTGQKLTFRIKTNASAVSSGWRIRIACDLFLAGNIQNSGCT